LPNGDLEVDFNNGTTPAGNPNEQQLCVHCKPTGSSSAGTAHLNCATPAKVGDDIIAGEPLCNFGRGPEECIPGAFIRTNDFPRIAVNPGNGDLFATWQDYRNKEFDIQLATSTNGGHSWSISATVNPDSGLDHYFAADAVAPSLSTDRAGDGDYSGLILQVGAEAHPIWSDTRNLNPFPLNGVAHDEDIFTNTVGLPAGTAKPGTGRVGQN